MSEAAQNDKSKVTRIWELILEIYTACEDLWKLGDDQRKLHAAELIVTAWKRHEKTLNDVEHIARPHIITALEKRIKEFKKGDASNAASDAPKEVNGAFSPSDSEDRASCRPRR